MRTSTFLFLSTLGFFLAIPSAKAAEVPALLVPQPIFTDTTPLPTPTKGVGSLSEIATLPTPPRMTTSSTVVLPSLLSAAHESQDLLKVGVDTEKVTKKNLEQMALAREIAFVFLDTQTQERVRVDGLFDGKTWKPIKYTSANFPNVTVKLKGLSAFTYSYPGNRYVMLAVKYPKWSEVLDKKKKRTGVEERIVIKTPVQKEFQTPEIALAGEQMLNEVTDKALADLAARAVKSKAHPTKTLVQAADPEMVKTLYVIEHSSLSELRTNSKATIDRFMVNFAINPDTAFAEQVSHMGAQGIGQFMPSTYQRLAKRSDLGLIQDTTKGTRDHVNATKAAFALIDAFEADLPDMLYTTTSMRLPEAIAASYNGGSLRVKTLISRDVWFDQIDGVIERTAVKKRSRVPVETLDYVKKLRIVYPVMKERSNRLES